MFEIGIRKLSSTNGMLVFKSEDVSVESSCWFAASTPAEAGRTYECAATRMSSKTDSITGGKRPGIFFKEFESRGIFIHEGPDVSWSENCIVLPRGEMMRVWNHIVSKGYENKYVITVTVS